MSWITGKPLASKPSMLLKNSSLYTRTRRSSMPGGGGWSAGSRRWRAKVNCCSRKVSCSMSLLQQPRAIGIGHLHHADAAGLGQQFVQRREVEVALQQRRTHAESAVRAGQQRPHVRLHRRAMRIDLQVDVLVVVAGDVVLGDAAGRQAREEVLGVVAVVDGIDVQVVDV